MNIWYIYCRETRISLNWKKGGGRNDDDAGFLAQEPKMVRHGWFLIN